MDSQIISKEVEEIMYAAAELAGTMRGVLAFSPISPNTARCLQEALAKYDAACAAYYKPNNNA